MSQPFKQPKDDPANWDIPGGWCTQCGDMISISDDRCMSSMCNPPGENIRRDIRTRIDRDRDSPRDATLDVLEYYTEQAESVEDLKQVILTLLKEFRKSL